MPHSTESINVLGTRISVVNMETAVAHISSWIKESQTGRYVCVTGVHGVMEGFRDEKIKRIHNTADMCVPDGMPMTWIGRIKGHREMDRVYGPDLMHNLLNKAASEGWSNFFYGGRQGVADELVHTMQEKLGTLIIKGTFCPPFRLLSQEEENDFITRINTDPPDILWLGISTPRQEQQMWRFKAAIKAKVMIGVGAAFDFLTGRLKRPPQLIQRSGMEWLFRLFMEPGRLMSRYIRNNPSFLWHIMLQLSGIKKYPDTDE